MTNQTSSSPTPSPKEVSKEAARRKLHQVESLVKASPFRKLLELPPEEVLDWASGRVWESLVEGLLGWKDKASRELLSSARDVNNYAHQTVADQLYIIAGIDAVVDRLVSLPEDARAYAKVLREVKEH